MEGIIKNLIASGKVSEETDCCFKCYRRQTVVYTFLVNDRTYEVTRKFDCEREAFYAEFYFTMKLRYFL